MVAAVGVATCRLGDILGKPQGALLFVQPAAPDSLKAASAFGSTAPRIVPVNIENKGDGDLRWSAHTKHSSAWVTLDPDTGTAGQSPTLRVIFDPAGLDSGVYEDTVVVAAVSGTGSQETPLWFKIQSCSDSAISLDDSVSTMLTSADCAAPHRSGRYAKLYRFSGIANDSVSVEVVAGFDAYVAVDSSLAKSPAPLAQDDDCLGTPGNPCLYYNRLPRNATYYVEVTSADSADTGSFKMRLMHPRLPNAPASLDQRLNDSVTSVPIGTTVNALSLLLRGVVSDPDLGDSLHLEAEVRPVGVGFSGPNVPNGPTVANGQPAWVSTGTLSDKTTYHWRVRAGDNTGRQGLWNALPGSSHFTINVPHPPDNPASLAQAKGDGTALGVGVTADTDIVILSATVTDQDPGDQLRLVVEVRPIGTAFTAPTDSSAPVINGGALQVRVGPLNNNTSYHWRARAMDQVGDSSAWVSFGGNGEGATDFRIALPHVPLAPDSLAQYQNDGVTPIALGGATPSGTAILKGKVSDPDIGQTVQLDAEVKPVGTAFVDTANFSSSLVTNNTFASVTVAGLTPNTCYHWQARAKDNTGRGGAWLSFPQTTPNLETQADFCVQQPPTELVFTAQPPASTVAGVAMTPAIQVAARDINHNVVTSFTDTVTMSIDPGNNPGGGTLSGTLKVAAVAGVATFSNLSITRTGVGYKLRANTTSLTNTSSAFTITAAPTTQLVFTTNPPASTQAGASMAPAVAVTAEDNFGNTTPSYGTGVTLSIAFNAGNPPGTLSGGGPITPVNGVATFPAVSINKTGSGYLLQAASGSLKPDTSTAFTITAGPVTKVAFQVQPPASAPANTPISPTIQVAGRDANDNLVSSFGGNVALAITAGTGATGAVLSGGGATAAVGGVASFPSAAIDLIGSGYTLTATSSGLASGVSTSFMIVNSPVSPTLSSVTANPTTITACSTGCTTGAGTASIVTVTARDGGNNPVAGVSATLTAPGATISPAGSQNTNASGVATWTLTATASGAKALSAIISSVSIADTATVNVGPAQPASLVITTGPTNTAAGAAINSGTGVVVTARDQFGNTATSFTSVVTMAIAAGPAGGTFAPTSVNTATAAAGVANFPGLRIYKAGSGYQLQATGGALPPSTLSSAFTINTAPLVKLGFIVQPGTSADSAQITPAPQVAGQDSVGNTVASFTALVRMFIGQPGGGGTLSGTTSTNAVSGVATFSNLRINAMGTGYTLLTTSTGLASDESVPFDIIAGPASKLVYSVQPPLQTVAGAVMSPAIQVTAQDNQGNTATSFAGGVTLAIAAGTGTTGAILSGGGATASAGVATFPSASIDKAGTGYRLTASATGLTGATSNLFDIVSGGVSATLSTIARNPTSITASAPTAPITSTITVTAKDGLGNPISGLPVVLSATGTGNTPTQPAAVTDINGQATGTISSTVAESKTISATINGTLINATTTVIVNPAAAKQLVFVSQPTNTIATQTIKAGTGVTVEVRDTFNNRVTGAGNSVNVSILNNAGTPVPGTLFGTTPRTPSAGVVTFNDLSIDRIGTGYTLLTSSAGLISDTSSAFNITVGAATHLGFVQQPTQTAGGATITPAVTVEILDAGNNRVTTAGNSVSMAILNNPSGGTLTGTSPKTAVSGLATFSDLSIDKAGPGYTIRATATGLTGVTSSSFDIVVGLPAKLVFGQEPTSAVAGVAISPAVTVRILDAGNNLVTTASNSISMAILNNAGGGSLSGTLSHNASGGIATFSDLSIDKAGTGYTLSATGVGPGATSNGFNITPAAASHLVFTVEPGNTKVNTNISPDVVVTALDQFGNVATGFTGEVVMAIDNNPSGTAGLTYTAPVNAVSGVATFSDLKIDTVDNLYTLIATATGLTGITSSQFNITP